MYEWRQERDNCPFPDLLETYGSRWYATIYHQFDESNIPHDMIINDYKLKPETTGELESFRELKKIQTHIEEFTEKGLNVFIWGSTGTGKTTYGIKLLKEYIKTYYFVHPGDYGHPTVMYVSVPELIRMFLMNRFSPQFDKMVFDMSKCFLLLLDDIGFMQIPPDMATILYTILQQRLTNKLSTIYTSNVAGKILDSEKDSDTNLYKILGTGLLYSRTWGSCRPEHRIMLIGRDRRGDK